VTNTDLRIAIFGIKTATVFDDLRIAIFGIRTATVFDVWYVTFKSAYTQV